MKIYFTKHQSGFTLTELIVVMAMIILLTAIALPSYRSYMISTRRSDAKVALLDLAGRMDRYFTENNTYVGAALPAIYPVTSPNGYYTIQITSATATAYTITAAPTGVQTSDTECATFTYNSQAQKGITGTGTAANCW